MIKKNNYRMPIRKRVKENQPNATIYITNIHTSVTEELLLPQLSKFGLVRKFRFETRLGQTKQYKVAFVTFSKAEEAEKAIETLDGVRLFCWEISVGFNIEKQVVSQLTQIDLKNLPPTITYKLLKRLLSQWDKPLTVVINRFNDGNSLGKGHATYYSVKAAKKVVRELNDFEIMGYKLNVRFSSKSYQKPKKKTARIMKSLPCTEESSYKLNTIFIEGLSSLVRKSVLEMVFGKYGCVVKVTLLKTQRKAFIEYETVEQVFKALSKFESDEEIVMLLEEGDNKEGNVQVAKKKDLQDITRASLNEPDSDSSNQLDSANPSEFSQKHSKNAFDCFMLTSKKENTMLNGNDISLFSKKLSEEEKEVNIRKLENLSSLSLL